MNLKTLISNFIRRFRKSEKNPINDEIIKDLYGQLSDMEKRQREIERILADKNHFIDKIIVEQMHADKIEFNMDAIDVKELSGMLSIGINYEGKLVKIQSKEAGEKQEDKQDNNSSQKTKKPKINIKFS
ncbi:MAG: hypothetical protein PHE70_10530 [Tepidanaerobacteraceae bacterium]|nr:hypothetical protein [Tepidanaerobacteraceae bacterium]